MLRLVEIVRKAVLAPLGLKVALAGAAMGMTPTAALARHHGIHIDIGIRAGPIVIEPAPVPVPPPPSPIYQERTVQVWVDPVYQTVSDRQWVPPSFQTVVDRVWVAPQYQVRDVMRFEYGCWRLCRQMVLIAPGHYEQTTRQELQPGHWEIVQHQELLTPGHWETRIEQVPVQ